MIPPTPHAAGVAVLAPVALASIWTFGVQPDNLVALTFWLVYATLTIMVVNDWILTARRARQDAREAERYARLMSKARHPSSRGKSVPLSPLPLVQPRPHDRILTDRPRRMDTSYERDQVHNHGPDEGLGLACPEYATKDGRTRGLCIISEAISKDHEDRARRSQSYPPADHRTGGL